MTITEKMQEILKNEEAHALVNELLNSGNEFIATIEFVYETLNK